MSMHRIAAFGSIAVVAAAVVAGLVVTGSPSEQRLLRLDDQRVNDLQQLSRTAEFRWNEAQRLPASAADLVDGNYLSRLPVDPVTGEPYGYRVTGVRAFEVCATFDRRSRETAAASFWFHEAGDRCFSFELEERIR